MTSDERQQITLLADALDVQVEEILTGQNLPDYPRELRIAMERIEEAAMWLRRGIERWK